jgi:TM2 domain-containing membrane protein YozV
MSSVPPIPETPVTSAAAPPPTYVVAPPPPTLPKSPAAATLLSIFPGLGQIYNGQVGKAFAFFGAWLGALYGGVQIDPMPFALMLPFVYLYNLVDAWKSANAINARFLGGRTAPEDDAVESPVWGGVLVIVGTVLLVHNLGWLELDFLRRWWPVLLIAAGVVFILRSLEARKSEGGGSVDGGSAL